LSIANCVNSLQGYLPAATAQWNWQNFQEYCCKVLGTLLLTGLWSVHGQLLQKHTDT